MGMTGLDRKTALKVAIGTYALNRQISDEESQEAAAYREYFANARFAYATA